MGVSESGFHFYPILLTVVSFFCCSYGVSMPSLRSRSINKHPVVYIFLVLPIKWKFSSTLYSCQLKLVLIIFSFVDLPGLKWLVWTCRLHGFFFQCIVFGLMVFDEIQPLSYEIYKTIRPITSRQHGDPLQHPIIGTLHHGNIISRRSREGA